MSSQSGPDVLLAIKLTTPLLSSALRYTSERGDAAFELATSKVCAGTFSISTLSLSMLVCVLPIFEALAFELIAREKRQRHDKEAYRSERKPEKGMRFEEGTVRSVDAEGLNPFTRTKDTNCQYTITIKGG